MSKPRGLSLTEKQVSLFICDEGSTTGPVQVSTLDSKSGNLVTLPEVRIFGESGPEIFGEPPLNCIYEQKSESRDKKKAQKESKGGTKWVTVFCCSPENTKAAVAYFSDIYDILRVSSGIGNWVSIELTRTEDADEIVAMRQPILVAPKIAVFVKPGRYSLGDERPVKEQRNPKRWTELKDNVDDVKQGFWKTVLTYLRDIV